MRMIFVLPVRDLPASRAFFTAPNVGWNEQHSDDSAAEPIADAHGSTGVLLALSADSRERVEATVARTIEQGGTRWKPVLSAA